MKRPGKPFEVLLTLCAGAVLLVAMAGPAAADLKGPCQASAEIDGKTYTPDNDTKDNPVVIPEKDGLVAHWIGSTTKPITDHMGKIYVKVGFGRIKITEWGSANKPKPSLSDEGNYSLEGARDNAFSLVGLYRVEGYHQGKGGSCKGFVFVKIEGNPLGTVPGLATTGTTLLAGLGMIFAAMAKKGV